MNRADLKRLQSVHGYPALSILAPMHRSAPENRQDPIRVKNLVKQAVDRLRKEFSAREVDGLVTNLERLAQGVEYRHSLDGLALFVSRTHSHALHLPFPVRERVVIDATFATRDLVAGLNRSGRYWVVTLSEKSARLFTCIRTTVLERPATPFPMTDAGAAEPKGKRGGHGHGDFTPEKSAAGEEQQRKFLRRVDAALASVVTRDPRPVFLLGGNRPLAVYQSVANKGNHVSGTLAGSYDKASPAELTRIVTPLVEAHEAAQRRQAHEELDAAIHRRKYASGMQEAWSSAHEGRGSLLLVEEGFFYPARLDGSAQELAPAADPAEPGVIDDAVDELIERVIAQGGRVVFVPDGDLKDHGRVALALRY